MWYQTNPRGKQKMRKEISSDLLQDCQKNTALWKIYFQNSKYLIKYEVQKNLYSVISPQLSNIINNTDSLITWHSSQQSLMKEAESLWDVWNYLHTNMSNFWVVMLCEYVGGYLSSRGTFRLSIEAVSSPKILVPTSMSTWQHSPQDHNQHFDCTDNQKSHILSPMTGRPKWLHCTKNNSVIHIKLTRRLTIITNNAFRTSVYSQMVYTFPLLLFLMYICKTQITAKLKSKRDIYLTYAQTITLHICTLSTRMVFCFGFPLMSA